MRIHSLVALAMLAVTPAAIADNFAECLLDKLPGVQNHSATQAAHSLCRKEHKGGFETVKQGYGRGFFAKFDSGGECTLALGRDTSDRQGAHLIATACRRLYDEPNPWDRYTTPER